MLLISIATVLQHSGLGYNRKDFTMQLKIKNNELNDIINFLSELKLKNKASRGRTKLIKLMTTKITEYNEDLEEIRDPFLVHKNGERVVENEQYILKEGVDIVDLNKQLEELGKEKAVIMLDEYVELIKVFKEALDNYAEDFSNRDAVIYDYLATELEGVLND
jgi:transcriptional regulator of heat shock response